MSTKTVSIQGISSEFENIYRIDSDELTLDISTKDIESIPKIGDTLKFIVSDNYQDFPEEGTILSGKIYKIKKTPNKTTIIASFGGLIGSINNEDITKEYYIGQDIFIWYLL
jgi:hypothetical protein